MLTGKAGFAVGIPIYLKGV
uniref:Uncharacterized protein n=1 Tax=Anguilla anguilla TaxID=7936 RepID=A0A0E9U811_ANGAN